MRLRKIKQYKMNSLIYYLTWSRMTMLKKLTVRRLINVLGVLYEWKTGRSVAKSRPFVFRLEPSVVCNLKCPSCFTPKKVFRTGQVRQMSLQAFETIFKSISKSAYRMTFYIAGEPMTNPWLFDMIKMAGKDKVYTSFCTNFTLMKEKLIEPLFESKLDWISVCLDGFTQEAFEKYRVGGDVDRVKDGIKMVMEHKREHGYGHPFLNVFTTMFKHVQPEIEMIKSFCEEQKVDQLRLRPDESNWDGSHSNKPQKLPYSKCFWPWMSMSIDVDGSVYPCSYSLLDRNGLAYGNLLENSMDEIWNNQLFIGTRKFVSGKSARDPNLNLPCYTCRAYGSCSSREGTVSTGDLAKPRAER